MNAELARKRRQEPPEVKVAGSKRVARTAASVEESLSLRHKVGSGRV